MPPHPVPAAASSSVCVPGADPRACFVHFWSENESTESPRVIVFKLILATVFCWMESYITHRLPACGKGYNRTKYVNVI